MIPPLPRLEAEPTCQKCGKTDPMMSWTPAMGRKPEQLDLYCPRCGFTWIRLPLDSTPADLDVADVVKP